MHKDPQKTWDEYYADIRNRRESETRELWQQIAAAGVTEDTVLAMDFLHFTSDPTNAKALAEQLRENYEIKISPSSSPNYWNIEGTTRPHGISLTMEDHAGWVEFMCDVAQSHGCVFSTWNLEDPRSGQSWSNVDE